MLFTIEKSTETKNKTFCTKLVANVTKTVSPELGDIVRKVTFYIYTTKQGTVGTTTEINPSDYNVVEKEYELPDGENKGDIVLLKTLQLKS